MTTIEQIKKAWAEWHHEIDPDLIPEVNPSFWNGFLAGQSESTNELVRLRGEAQVLRLLLAEAVELIEDWANGLELDYEDIDDSVRLLGQMRRALGEEES